MTGSHNTTPKTLYRRELLDAARHYNARLQREEKFYRLELIRYKERIRDKPRVVQWVYKLMTPRPTQPQKY